MSQIHPLAGVIAQTPQAQRIAAADREAQINRTLIKEKNSIYGDHKQDEFVESTDAISALGDEDAHKDPRQKKPRHHPTKPAQDTDAPDDTAGDKPHIDIRA